MLIILFLNVLCFGQILGKSFNVLKTSLNIKYPSENEIINMKDDQNQLIVTFNDKIAKNKPEIKTLLLNKDISI